MDLNRLVELVREKWPCGEEQYPGMDALSDEEKQHFELCHVVMHQVEMLGQIATACERKEHGAIAPGIDIPKNIRRSLINTIRMAIIIGMTAEELVGLINQWANSKTDP